MKKRTIPRLGVAFLETEEMTACGLYSFLNSQPELACLWSADDFRVTLKNLTVSQPQILLVDAEIGLAKIYTLLQALRKHPGVSTVVWSRDPYSLPLTALKAKGVRGIIPKNSDAALLLECFLTTAAGKYYGFGSEMLASRDRDEQFVETGAEFATENQPTKPIAPEESQNGHSGTIGKPVQELSIVRSGLVGETFTNNPSFPLSPRDVEIGKLVILGYANKEIAAMLLKRPEYQDLNDPYTGLSEGTIKVYLNRLFKKLGVLNRQELILAFLALRIYPELSTIRERLVEFKRRQQGYASQTGKTTTTHLRIAGYQPEKAYERLLFP